MSHGDSLERTRHQCRRFIDSLPADLDLGECDGKKIILNQHLLMQALALTVPGDLGYRLGVYDGKLVMSWLCAPDSSLLVFTSRGSLVIYNKDEPGCRDLMKLFQCTLPDPESSLARLMRCPSYWVALRRVCRQFRLAMANQEDLGI